MIQVTKGMRDFYPEDYRIQEWLFNIFKQASKLSGFEYYDCPVVEAEELYVRKAGEEITEQLYTFEDKSNRKLALRPEMTPSLARMVIQKFKEFPGKIKWTSIPQCFRYERMTRGRKREHYQWNLDYLGEKSMMAELDIIATAIHAFELMGLSSKNVRLRISNRKLLSDLLLGFGVLESQIIDVFLSIDKLGKIKDEQIIELLEKAGLSSDLSQKVLEVIYIKDIKKVKTFIDSCDASNEGYLEIQELFSLLEIYGFSDYLEFDFSIVRGLAYYTGTVFEFFDARKTLRAIAGGGRYDNLIQNLADVDLPPKAKGSIKKEAVGFGFGDVVIFELLKDLKLLPELKLTLDYYLIPFSEDEVKYLLPIVAKLRNQGFTAEIHYPPQKPKKMFEMASKRGAKNGIIAGSQELDKSILKVKNFRSREETQVRFTDFMDSIS
ncbi:MAG: histidine--tRNA ligase [Candidatus Cloacimonadota bacterium]|nr:MAG: histidine--tRNA ligase [Candidatus Cloacimonadota bacterium]